MKKDLIKLFPADYKSNVIGPGTTKGLIFGGSQVIDFDWLITCPIQMGSGDMCIPEFSELTIKTATGRKPTGLKPAGCQRI